MAKHQAICRVSKELADEFRKNLPPNTRIVAESIMHSETEAYFKLENSAFPETPSGEKLPFVNAIFLRSDDGVITFAKWETYA